VADIRKDLPASETDGENVGIVKFSARGASRLVTIMDRIVGSGSLCDWAPRAFGEFAREEALYAVGTRGFPWTEIDTPEDYQRALREVFPAIEEPVAASVADTTGPRDSGDVPTSWRTRNEEAGSPL
jgi:choline kinase